MVHDVNNPRGDLYDHSMSMRIFHFDNEKIIHMRAPKTEESGYGFNVGLLTKLILYWSCVSYPRRRGLLKKNDYLRPIYLGVPRPCKFVFELLLAILWLDIGLHKILALDQANFKMFFNEIS